MTISKYGLLLLYYVISYYSTISRELSKRAKIESGVYQANLAGIERQKVCSVCIVAFRLLFCGHKSRGLGGITEL